MESDLNALSGAPRIQAVQLQIMELLAERIRKYTAGESASVRVEVAEELLRSMLYCIKAYLDTLPNPGAAFAAMDAGKLLKQGEALILRYATESKGLLAEVRRTRIPTALIAYNQTIDVALPMFFRKYDPVYFAHDTIAMIDYPIQNDDPHQSGILYIRHFLREMLSENQYCARFSAAEIRAVLSSFGKKHRLPYYEMLENIAELMQRAYPETQ